VAISDGPMVEAGELIAGNEAGGLYAFRPRS